MGERESRSINLCQGALQFVNLVVWMNGEFGVVFSINYVPYFTMCSIPQLFYVVATSYQNQCKTTEMLKQRGMDIYWTFLLDNSVCICVSVWWCECGVSVWCECGVCVWCECGVCVWCVCVDDVVCVCVCVYTVALCGSFFHCSL